MLRCEYVRGKVDLCHQKAIAISPLNTADVLVVKFGFIVHFVRWFIVKAFWAVYDIIALHRTLLQCNLFLYYI